MKILFYRYNSICETSIIWSLERLGHQITEIREEMTNKELTAQEQLALVSTALKENKYDFVFSIDYFPVVSEVCNIFKIPYASWIVDSPVMELFSDSIRNPWNRVFLFDRALYEEFSPQNPSCIFYCPLASNVVDMNRICDTITTEDVKKYASDISFVGSLYTEKSPYDRLENPPEYLRGYLEGIMESQLKIYGYNFMEEVLTDSLVAEFKKHFPGFYTPPEKYTKNEIYTLANLYMGNKVASMERLRLLGSLSEHFSIDLYTASDTSALPKVHNKGLIETFINMPKVFRLSKINLNMTSKAIKTALPLRIWDIMACGGFVMTNFQSEIPDIFDIGVDLETYSSEEELLEKCAFYLTHEEERKKIAKNGYDKVCLHHTLEMRLTEMIANI